MALCTQALRRTEAAKQALASSEDGVHFKKHGRDLPAEYSLCDFRDPKIFEEDGILYCLVAARKVGGRGRILLYSSEDIFKCKFVYDVSERDCGGIMIECPDYLKNLGLITYCQQFQPAQGATHLNVQSTFYRFGILYLKSGQVQFGESEIIDYGLDFYAAQLFAEDSVMIGRLNMWGRNTQSDKYGFAGMLTVPRKLKIENGGALADSSRRYAKVIRKQSCRKIFIQRKDGRGLDK